MNGTPLHVRGKLADATNNGSRVTVSSTANNLAVFGLLPLPAGQSLRPSSLFCRDVMIEPKSYEDPWESIHLHLM